MKNTYRSLTELCRFYHRYGKWKFGAVANGFKDGLQSLLTNI